MVNPKLDEMNPMVLDDNAEVAKRLRNAADAILAFPWGIDSSTEGMWHRIHTRLVKLAEHYEREAKKPKLPIVKPVVKRSDLHPPYELPGFMTLNQWNAQHAEDGAEITLWSGLCIQGNLSKGTLALVPPSPWMKSKGITFDIVYTMEVFEEAFDEIMKDWKYHDTHKVTLTT